MHKPQVSQRLIKPTHFNPGYYHPIKLEGIDPRLKHATQLKGYRLIEKLNSPRRQL